MIRSQDGENSLKQESKQLVTLDQTVLVFDIEQPKYAQQKITVSRIQGVGPIYWRFQTNAPTCYIVNPNEGLMRDDTPIQVVITLYKNKFRPQHELILQAVQIPLGAFKKKELWDDMDSVQVLNLELGTTVMNIEKAYEVQKLGAESIDLNNFLDSSRTKGKERVDELLDYIKMTMHDIEIINNNVEQSKKLKNVLTEQIEEKKKLVIEMRNKATSLEENYMRKCAEMAEESTPNSENTVEKKEANTEQTSGQSTKADENDAEKCNNTQSESNGNEEEEEEEPVPAKKREAVDNSEASGTEKNEAKTQESGEKAEETSDLDDDQQVENPAYIPKTGKFYMHDDDRRGEEDKNNTDTDELKEGKKKSRADGMWKHDRFDEKNQRPKTKKQIVTKYGFDIRTDAGEDGDTSERKETAAESNGDDSDVRREVRKTRGARGRGGRRGGNHANRGPRRPLKQREREDTVDESEEKVEERPAQKRQERPEKQAPKPSKPKENVVSRSSDECEDEEDDDQLRRGQRRSAPRGVRRGFGSGSRLRGRITTAPRRSDSGHYRERENSQRAPPSVRSRGANRGFSRGFDRGPTRGNERRFSDRGPPSRRDYSSRRNEDSARNDDRFQNHRRGVIRGAGVASRGSNRPMNTRSGPPASRGAPPMNRGGGQRYGGPTRREDTSEHSDNFQKNSDYNSGPRAQPPPPPPPQTSTARGPTFVRGGIPNPPPPTYANGRGGYSNGGPTPYHAHGPTVAYPPKRFVEAPAHVDYGVSCSYPMPVQQMAPIPAIVPVGVVPTNVPPPQMTRGASYQRIRQPTDVVYYDPVQQQLNRMPPPSRAKKVIPIVDPNTSK
ncbi:unnamed protein product [Caenorhabditis bovis]|uniref:Protein CASC3 n=1 Tax=Caenorhabditis bovis TaxID=2654633 RepID=A0A8S1F2Z9_9PELO|nr:unnamed protein product [Caenorhabditis bovis]